MFAHETLLVIHVHILCVAHTPIILFLFRSVSPIFQPRKSEQQQIGLALDGALSQIQHVH